MVRQSVRFRPFCRPCAWCGRRGKSADRDNPKKRLHRRCFFKPRQNRCRDCFGIFIGKFDSCSTSRDKHLSTGAIQDLNENLALLLLDCSKSIRGSIHNQLSCWLLSSYARELCYSFRRLGFIHWIWFHQFHSILVESVNLLSF